MPSVIIPAHNEEAVIGRCLRSLLADAPPGALDVIVVANGCCDRTAMVASSFGPDVRVIELTEASKHAALNAGDSIATRFPRAFVDADVEVKWSAIDAVGKALDQSGALVGAPQLDVDLTGCPWYVRSFCRVWLRQPWMTDAPVGTGVYVLSQAGHARLGRFPNITNDDQYVHDLFSPDERCSVADHRFVVRAPRTFRGLVARRTRTMAGAVELEARFGRLPGLARRRGPAEIVRDSPELAIHLPVFLAVTVLARRGARHKQLTNHNKWERDDSSRVPTKVRP
jgi:glycosyltransferase involved in cell wall biosynthesis